MGTSEFDLIRDYFAAGPRARAGVVRGIGDDGAVLRVPPGMDLVVSVDTLVDGVHFPPRTAPQAIGYKALAVGLSDLAAMGAEPAWATLALTLPEADCDWVRDFCQGMFGLAAQYGMELVGGDTTRGPLTVSVAVHGLVPQGAALRRAGARTGDLIYVTGTLGDAALGLLVAQGRCPGGTSQAAALVARLERPQPRVREGCRLRDVVHAAIDISDGLVADLGHVLVASGVGATIYVERLPLSEAFRAARLGLAATPAAWLDLALAGGDDYELCFTVAPPDEARLAALCGEDCVPLTCIGVVTAGGGVRCLLENGAPYRSALGGYDHFA